MTDDLPSSQHAEGSFIYQANQGSSISVLHVSQPDSLSPPEKRNREEMLHKVKKRIMQKLSSLSFVWDVPLEYRSDEVVYTEESDLISSNKDIIQHFEHSNGRLLILGDPGSGKTILLYRLARDLVDRALDDISQSIPVILNLSSWMNNYDSFDKWIIDELFDKYDISNNLSKRWISTNSFILLLDGLDEVKSEFRGSCVETINEFRSHYHSQIVICTRVEEYEALDKQLMLQEAIYILPLSEKQVDSFLSQPGLDKLRSAINESREIRSFLRSPLVLDIFSRTYFDASSDWVDDSVGNMIEMQSNSAAMDSILLKQMLFSNYIQRMFEHYSAKSDETKRSMINPKKAKANHKLKFTKEGMMSWLAWLAHQMVKHGETFFFFENLQPSWVEKRGQRYFYRILVFVFLSLLGGLFMGLGMWVISGRMSVFLEFFKIGSGSILYFSYLYSIRRIRVIQKLRLSESSIVRGIRISTNVGIILGFTAAMKSLDIHTANTVELASAIIGGFFAYRAVWLVAIIVVLVLYAKSGRQSDVIESFFLFQKKRMDFSQIDFYSALKRNFLFVILVFFVSILAIADRVMSILNGYLGTAFVPMLIFGLSAMVIGVVGFGIYFGLSGEVIDARDSVNQGIFRSLRIAMVGGLFSGLSGIILIGRLIAIFIGTTDKLLYFDAGFTFLGLILIYLGFLRLGGSAFFQHFILRLTLVLFGYIPFNYKDFLEQASKLMFLRRIGGGYEFWHRDLMEYFSQIYD